MEPQITFRHVESSPLLRNDVQARIEELHQYYQGIIGCRVTIEAPHHRRRNGDLFRVRVDVTVPGEELVVGHHPGQNEAHEDLNVAVRDAFDAMNRQLQDYARRRRREVKERVSPPHGVVVRTGEQFGFLMADDGREIYFHRNSVVGDYQQLAPGAEVRFAEEMGDKGPQASSVVPVGKNGHASTAVGSDHISREELSMAKQVEQVMTRNPKVVNRSTNLRDAACIMRDSQIGDVLVCEDDGRLAGIVTDRDIVVRGLAQGCDIDRTTVGEICSAEPIGLAPTATVDEAVTLMRDRAVRRVPVVQDGRPVGILSIGDLAQMRDPESALAEISAAPPST